MTLDRIVRTIYAIWYRETMRFLRDRARWVGLVSQPLLYLVLVGYGISSSMSFRHAPAGTDYLAFMYPGILGMSVLFTAIFSAIGIIWDREFGFLKEVLVAPAPRWAVAGGKALGIATIVVLQTALLLVAAPIAHVGLGVGMALGTLGIAALTGLTVGSIGIFVASRMQTLESFQLIMNVLTLPMFFLSGALYPIGGLPGWLSVLAHADPLTYGVDALRSVIYPANATARALIQYPLVFDLTVLAVACCGLAVAAGWSFEKQSA